MNPVLAWSFMDDYRSILRGEFERRKKKNSRYSHRAFARHLEITPSHLSQFFAGRRGLSESRAADILKKMPWNEDDKDIFWASFRYESCNTKDFKDGLKKELLSLQSAKRKRHLATDEFTLISDWHHYAILELIKREDFQNDPLWICEQLRIDKKAAKTAIERLKKLRMIAESDGRLEVREDFYTSGDVPLEAIRINHEQHLQLAQRALWDQSVDERNFSGITMTIDPDKLPEAQKMIQEFRRKLMRLMESGRRRQVYRLSVQLFRLDKKTEEK